MDASCFALSGKRVNELKKVISKGEVKWLINNLRPSCQQEGLDPSKVRQPAHIVQSNLKIVGFARHGVELSGYRRVGARTDFLL